MTMEQTDNKGRDALAQVYKDKDERAAIDAKRAQEEAEKGMPILEALGKEKDAKTSVYYWRERRDLIRLKPHEYTVRQLMDIAEIEDWGQWLFPEQSKDYAKNHRNEVLEEAVVRLMRAARVAGSYDSARERKIGLWCEVVEGEKGILCNSGAALHFMPVGGGALREVGGVHGGRFYTVDKPLPPPAADMATNDEGDIIVSGFRSLIWAFSGAGELAAGWMVCSLLAGLLNVRPSVWLTGAKGSGKTRIYEIIAKLLGWIKDAGDEALGNATEEAVRTGYGLLLESLETSSPGVRQTLNSTLRPILFDEVEGNGEAKNEATLRGLLAVIRSSATSSNGIITKGGKDGRPIEYMVRSCFLLCSIQSRLDNAADRSRIVELPICAPTAEEKKAMAKKQDALEALANDPNFCGRLIHRVMKLAPVFAENNKRLRAHLANKLGDYRKADIFAPMLAGCYLLRHDGFMGEDDMQHALIVVRSYEKTQEEADDGAQCLAVLLNAVIYHGGMYGKMTTRQVFEALGNAGLEQDRRDALEQALGVYGMRRIVNKQGETILEVLTGEKDNPNLKDIYRTTRWTNGKISAVICPGDKPNAARVTTGNRNGYGRTLRIPDYVVTPREDEA